MGSWVRIMVLVSMNVEIADSYKKNSKNLISIDVLFL